MPINFNTGEAIKPYGYDCAEDVYNNFPILTGYLISGKSIPTNLTGTYNSFGSYSNSLTTYNSLKYGSHNFSTYLNATTSPNNFLNHTLYTGRNFFEISAPSSGGRTGIFITGKLDTLSSIFSPCINNKIPLTIAYTGANTINNELKLTF